MDKDLRRIDMTDEERARFLLAVEQTKFLPADEIS
ncbi:hypothetical protein J2Z19_005794 [Ensifer adhaerens]|uniref:Uncharacterized protein n=1 Tax=Ensifer adhaerens TaxID=106592 RepID=A0ACC5T4J6_ENSAD|nr:hypothetical protein [Ensifer adhaerens]